MFNSYYDNLLNIGSDEMISKNDMAKMTLRFTGKDVLIQYISGLEGVKGRNSNNTLIKKVLI